MQRARVAGTRGPSNAGSAITVTDQHLATVRRFDVGGELLRAVRRANDGVLLAEGIPVREGVLIYRMAGGGERRELVTRQAVLDTARTLPRAALTLEHPAEGFVNADSYQRLGVGDVDGEALVEEDAQGGFARVKVAVRRRDALDAVEGGVHELSPGYEVTLDETPGTHPVFGRYDASQIGRSCNHLALVQKGRGNQVVLRVDSADAVQVGVATPVAGPTRTDHGASMKPGLIALLAALGVTRFDSEEQAVAEGKSAADKLLAADKARHDGAEDLAKLKEENEKLKADLKAKSDECAEMKGKADASAAELEKLKKTEGDRKDAAELADLRGLAGKVGVKHDGLDLPSLRVAVAKSRIDSIDAKSDPAYVAGVIGVIKADVAKRGDSVEADATRWDWRGAGRGDGAGADPKERERADRADPFYDPYLTAADAARTDSSPAVKEA